MSRYHLQNCGDCRCRGVRRSALISLSSLTDERMRDAKSGAWWEADPQRALANNSVAYREKPEPGIFMEEWLSLYKSKYGERGIFNREAAQLQIEKQTLSVNNSTRQTVFVIQHRTSEPTHARRSFFVTRSSATLQRSWSAQTTL